MFVDNVEIQVRAGHGGSGLASFRREKFLPFGGPDGGDGGKGGDVYLYADSNLESLVSFKHKRLFKADNGGDGGKNRMHGTNAAGLIIRVPVGTSAYIIDNGSELLVADMTRDGQKSLLARGGRGGRGNVHFATSTRKAPRMFQQGEEGQQFNIMLRMSLVVDVCIVGFTNSGKSTLLSALSSARPEIADYRFTTKTPVLGVVDDGVNKLIWVELPALTKDSRLGKGLGNTFLKQAVRASAIVYLLDAGSSDLKGDFDILRDEVSAFDKKLRQKASTIVINKVDSANSLSLEDYVKNKLEVTGLPCIMISSLDKTGLDILVTRVHQAVKEARSRPSDEPAAEVVFRPEPIDQREKK
ncbi:MAG: GTPase ObgE [Dehalococcoidia bacterium]